MHIFVPMLLYQYKTFNECYEYEECWIGHKQPYISRSNLELNLIYEIMTMKQCATYALHILGVQT